MRTITKTVTLSVGETKMDFQLTKLDAFAGARERERVNGQDDDQGQQADHHDLRDALQTALKAVAADQEAADDSDGHEQSHLAGIAQKGTEYAADFLGQYRGIGLCIGKAAGQELDKV